MTKKQKAPGLRLQLLSDGSTAQYLEISKLATPHVEKEFIHFDKLPDGTWRLLINVRDENGKQIATPDIHIMEIMR
ncbi:hypothetical protein BcepSauron_220 [Burkholderia phage BcepSauron]|uniref:Uncharacterized protein n=2 Tax=Sarumanvirus TaxID=2843450 RepID=A0A482MNC0_9CAUD|nr:hypothetical protein H1O16_gp218 [Burkholderia phage BcepSaruman]YP_009904598.1 hypothetical protein H1O17_gp220 [Burkholderia phage BcepSauron]QBQ74600.1 hypothetical protein BcepSauron_220 [Burkholderia phage BcepSauron]QBX06631.1 hypothetical protein BcepSaruman_218 [Burkholderia phage BcepSaruman]